MQEAQHPNQLRMLLVMAGLNQREAARESGIPEGTLRHYIAGDQVIPRRDRVKLAQVIGCEIQDLAPHYNIQGNMLGKPSSKYTMTNERVNEFSSDEEWNGSFSFGKLLTSGIVLDGDGITGYLPHHIRTFYDPIPDKLLDEIQEYRLLVEAEQLQRERDGFLIPGMGKRIIVSSM